jgi:hypothetical protein
MSVSIAAGKAMARGSGWSVSRAPGTAPSGPVSVSVASGKATSRGLGWSLTRTPSAVPAYTELAMTLARKRVILTLGSNALALELPRKILRMEIEG